MSMRTMTARELKNRSGEAFAAIARGERVLLTRRGKVVAVMVPAAEAAGDGEVPPYEVAWQEIEATLAATAPPFSSLAEAMARTRRRP